MSAPTDTSKTPRIFSSYFSDEARFNRLLLVFGGITAVLKGVRLPYVWAATQAQIDYRYGFLRRGLFGEICRQLHLPIWRYGIFTAISFLVVGCVLALLAWCVRRSGLDAAGLGAFTALIAGSFCISSLVNTVGYFELPMAILVLLTILIPNPRLQLAAVVLSGVAGVLVHEIYALTYLPISLVGPVCWASEQDSQHVRWTRWISVGCAALVPWLTIFFILNHAQLTMAQAGVLKRVIHARVDFQLDDPMLNVLAVTSRESLQAMQTYLRAGAWWVEEALGLLAFLPTTCFFLAIALREAARLGRVVKTWLVLATFSPLLLNIIAYDRYRWLALMTLNAMLAAITISYFNQRSRRQHELSRSKAEPSPIFSVAWRRAAVFLLVVNLATDIGFFKDHAKNFPFRDYWVEYRAAAGEKRPVFEPKELFPKHDTSQHTK